PAFASWQGSTLMKKTRLLSYTVCVCAAVVTLAGCSSPSPVSQFTPTTAGQLKALNSVQETLSADCTGFASNFDEIVACQRANGTLHSFGNPKVAWRVRYFVRYWAMPCNEDPTEQEGYVFHMATNDLYRDRT
ncbi:MAG: hypothetical protein ABI231_05650, partial [Candidatus Tumulicola sp.]